MDISSSVAAGLLTREAVNVSTIWTMLSHSDSPEDFRFTDEPADVTQTKVFVRLMSSGWDGRGHEHTQAKTING